jgi:ABC-type glycerol-3-phosphate transport system permease component
VILPFTFNAFNFLMFKGFFDTIPDSILQAARVDGGSEWNIFRRIVLPMSIPVFAVAIWLQFGVIFDAYQWPALVLTKENEATMVIMIQKLSSLFMSSAGTTNANAAVSMSAATRELIKKGFSWNGLMVLAIMQSLPGFVVFLITREFLTKGIRIRGLK